MRNYFKMLSMRWTDHNGLFYNAWGADEEQLLYFVRRMEAKVTLLDPSAPPFRRTQPQKCYFLLDDDNFGRLLNGAELLSAFYIWEATSLAGPGWINTFPQDNFFDFTKTESPRKTWSHGH